MIKTIKIEAFKSILDMELECSKLNLLVGANSSGKTTTLQVILLAAETTGKMHNHQYDLVSLGNFRDFRSFNSSKDYVLLEIYWENGKSLRLDICESDDSKEAFTTVHADNSLYELLDYQRGRLRYLSCQRIGHQFIYSKNRTSLDVIGTMGEYAIHYLNKHRGLLLDENMVKDSVQETLEYQVNYWLDYIVDASISTEDNIGPEFLSAYYTPAGSRPTRPNDIGSGVGYIISVLIMCLASKPGDIIIIENPEIHLHPYAQSKVCEFLYFIANAGRQLFVETHSDHLFNGIRKGIATGQMKSDDINVSFFSLDKKRCTKNTKIEFGKRGRILNTADGLFDQFDIDLNAMIGV